MIMGEEDAHSSVSIRSRYSRIVSYRRFRLRCLAPTAGHCVHGAGEDRGGNGTIESASAKRFDVNSLVASFLGFAFKYWYFLVATLCL